jgi:hypothetical protein
VGGAGRKTYGFVMLRRIGADRRVISSTDLDLMNLP